MHWIAFIRWFRHCAWNWIASSYGKRYFSVNADSFAAPFLSIIVRFRLAMSRLHQSTDILFTCQDLFTLYFEWADMSWTDSQLHLCKIRTNWTLFRCLRQKFTLTIIIRVLAIQSFRNFYRMHSYFSAGPNSKFNRYSIDSAIIQNVQLNWCV